MYCIIIGSSSHSHLTCCVSCHRQKEALMDDFSIIARKNGIYIPNTFLGNIFFHWKWQTAEKAYSIFQEKYRQRESEWNNYREGLKISWGRAFPEFSQIFKIRTLYFNSPTEAVASIESAKQDLDYFSLKEAFEFQDKMARLAWLNFEVLAKAPKNCKLIVLREVNFEPSRDKVSKFEASIAEHKPCSICLSDGGIIWLAFNPKDYFHEINNLKITGQFCKIEYLN